MCTGYHAKPFYLLYDGPVCYICWTALSSNKTNMFLPHLKIITKQGRSIKTVFD